jgi:hypothetical protein
MLNSREPKRIKASARQQRRKILTAASILLLVLLLVALLGFVGWRLPQWYAALQLIKDPKDRIGLENEIFKSVVGAIGGAFVLAGLYFTGRGFVLSREGQITERFSKAVEHLGSPELSIRLGGIHALARIAHDSPRDEEPIMQIMCAFVREATVHRTPSSRLPIDVSAALTLITTGEKGHPLDLTGVDLSGADLRNSKLDGANFEGSQLEGANLSHASLRNCRFRNANLTHCYCRGVDLEGADLAVATLNEASLREAILRGTNLFAARLSGTTLIRADLRGAKYATRDQFESAICDESTHLPEFSESMSEEPEPFL